MNGVRCPDDQAGDTAGARRQAIAAMRQLHVRDATVLHPDIHFPTMQHGGVFVPSALRKSHDEAPDEIFTNHAPIAAAPLLFEVTIAGRSAWLCGDQFARQCSRGFSIELVTHGGGELVVGRKRLTLQPGDVFILHPNERHAYRACTPEPFRKLFFWLDASTELHRRVLELAGLQTLSHVRLDDARMRRAVALIESIIATLRDAPTDARQRASQTVYEFICLLDSTVDGRAATQQLAQQIETVMQYALDHMQEPIRVAHLARVVHLSPDHLNRLFVRYLGLRAHEWLLRLRMRVAAELLCCTTEKIHSVAALVGYDNPYAFTRAFKKVAGITPETYRLRAWKTR